MDRVCTSCDQICGLECVMLDPVGLALLLHRLASEADQSCVQDVNGKRPGAHDEAQETQQEKQRVDDSDEIPEKLMRRIMMSHVWQRYVRGHIPSLEAAAQQMEELPFVKKYVADAADQAQLQAGAGGAHMIKQYYRPKVCEAMIARCVMRQRDSHGLQKLMREQMPAMATLLEALREKLQVKQLMCISNATAQEMSMLRTHFPTLFARFNATNIVISGEEGVGMNSQRFMQIAFHKTGIQKVSDCLYLDAGLEHADKQSIIAARSIGMQALHISAGHSQPPLHTSLTNNPHIIALKLQQSVLKLSIACKHCANPPSQSAPLIVPKLIPPSSANIELLANAANLSLAAARTFLFQSSTPGSKQGVGNEGMRWPFQFPSTTSDGTKIWDNFAQFLIAEALQDPRFLPMQKAPSNGLIPFVSSTTCNSVNIFQNVDLPNTGAPTLMQLSDSSTLRDIPEDIDTTGIGLAVLHRFNLVGMDIINKVLDNILEYVSEDDGILQVYLDRERPRIDPISITNALYLFHLAGRGKEVEKSEIFVQNVLLHRACEDGTLYYNNFEIFLFLLSRLVHRFQDHFARSGMRRLLKVRLREHRKSGMYLHQKSVDALALAMSMQAYSWLNLNYKEEQVVLRERETQELVQLQMKNGSWGCHPYCRYGSNFHGLIENEGLTTTYAFLAINAYVQHL